MSAVKKQTGSFKSYDGTSIYYEVRGDGEPIVFCYGIGCLINHWRHQLKFFSKNYQTITFDYRGHQKSDAPIDKSQLNVDALAQDIKALLDHLNIEQAHFIGHSFGVPVIINTYEKYPEIFKKIIFINGFAKNPLQTMFGSDVTSKVFNAVKKIHEVLPESSSFLWKKVVNNPISVIMSGLLGGFNLKLTEMKDIEIYTQSIANINLEAFLEIFQSMTDFNGDNVLRKIQSPTLIIAGEKDSITPKDFQKDMNHKIKNSELLNIPYGSHCTQLDMPDYVNLASDSFLRNED